MDPSFRVAALPASRGAAWMAESFKLFKAAKSWEAYVEYRQSSSVERRTVSQA